MEKIPSTQTVSVDSVFRQCVSVWVCTEALTPDLDKELSLKRLPSPCPHFPHMWTLPAPKPLVSNCWPSCLTQGAAPSSDTDRAPQRGKKEASGAYSTVRDVNRLMTVTSDPKQEERTRDMKTVWISSHLVCGHKDAVKSLKVIS